MSSEVQGDLANGMPVMQESIRAPALTEPKNGDLVLAEPTDISNQKGTFAVSNAGQKAIRSESERTAVSLPSPSQEPMAVIDSSVWHDSPEHIVLLEPKRNVQQLAPLPQRSFEDVLTEQGQSDVSLAIARPLQRNDQKRPSIFSGLFANLDLVPERFNRTETGDIKSKFLPNSYFNK